MADVACRRPPVARGHRQAVAVEQFQGRGAGRAIDPLQLEVQPLLQLAFHWPAQGNAQVRIEGEHRRQRAIAVDQRAQRTGIQAKLFLGLRAGSLQHALLGLALGEAGDQQHAGEDRQYGQGQAQSSVQLGHRQSCGERFRRWLVGNKDSSQAKSCGRNRR
ncbi:hypothetical protein D3C78_1296000 [compost metagenome]